MQSKRYSIFNNELRIMNDYVSKEEIFTRLNISEAQRTQLAEYTREFATVMNSYSDPEKKTSIVIKKVSHRYKEISRWVKSFRQGIKHSHKGELLSEDYVELYIHEDKVRHKHTVPESSPILEMEHIEHLNARISAHHYATYSKGTKPGVPEDADMIDWQWIVLERRDTSKSIVFTDKLTSHSATLKLEFHPDQESQFCHVVARYGINNGETGTYSEVLIFTIT